MPRLRLLIAVCLLLLSPASISMVAAQTDTSPTAVEERPTTATAPAQREERRRRTADGDATRPVGERRRMRQRERPAQRTADQREGTRIEPAAARRTQERTGEGTGAAPATNPEEVKTGTATPAAPAGSGTPTAPGTGENTGGTATPATGSNPTTDGAAGDGSAAGTGGEKAATGGIGEGTPPGDAAAGNANSGAGTAVTGNNPAAQPAVENAATGTAAQPASEQPGNANGGANSPAQSSTRTTPVERRQSTAPEAKPAPKPKPKAPPAMPVLRVDREAWRHLFQRQPLGFSQQTPRQVASDVAGWFAEAGRSPQRAFVPLGIVGWGFWLGMFLLAALITFGVVVERKRPLWWRRAWTGARALWRESGFWKWGVSVVERSAVPLVAFVAWSVGGLLVDVDSMPFLLVQSVLAAWCGYRLVDQGVSLVAARYPEGTPARDLYEQSHRLLLFTLFWGCAWIALELLDVRDDVVALWVKVGHLFLVLGLFGMLANRQRVLSVLRLPETGYFNVLRRVFTASYLPLVYASLVISLLWVAGYQQLASVVLGRSWALIAVLVVAVLVGRAGERILGRWLREDQERPLLRNEAYRNAQRLWGLVVVLIAIVAALRVLGLSPAVRYVLELRWVDVGAFDITGRAVLRTILILLLGTRLSGFLQALLAYRVYPRVGIAEGEAYALNRLLHYTLVVLSALLVLNSLGLSAESLAIVLGGLSVGIGFGLQNIANNIASGIILLTSRQVRRGDLVTVGEYSGNVQEVSLRSTRVTTFDSVDVLIPNSKLLDDTLVNWTHSGTTIRGKIPFGVAYGSNPKQVLQLVLDIAQAHPDVLEDPAPEVRFVNMGDNALEFELYFWLDMKQAPRPRVTTEIFCEIYDVLNKHGIELPFPQRDLHIRSGVPWAELLEAIRGKSDGAVQGNGQSMAAHSDQGDGASSARASSDV